MSLPVLLDPRDRAPAGLRALRPWLALLLAFPLRPREALEALRRFGDPWRAARSSRFAAAPAPGTIEATRAALAAVAARVLPFGSAAYPEPLAALDDAPPLLLVRGEAELLAAPCVAIVGARAATHYGRGAARELAADLAREGLVIVSGLARGIDAAAHEGALDAGGRTIAVQACGPERIYPPEHRALAERIARDGALVTEFAPGTPPLAFHFPLRNRLISGLAQALVVVEARQPSGSLITARHAADQGRDVYAVPGPIGAATSLGSNRLLRDGARPALDADDILLGLGRAPRARPARSAAPLGSLSQPARKLHAALELAPASREELASRLGRTPAQLALALLELELEGVVVEEPDGRLHPVRTGAKARPESA